MSGAIATPDTRTREAEQLADRHGSFRRWDGVLATVVA
jgi:hypothetical protein